MDVSAPACTTEYRQFPIQLPLVPLRLAAHGMLVVRSGETILHVLEGLATGADGTVKAIGRTRTDSIRFYDRGLAFDWRLSLALALPQVLFAGGEGETRRRVALALEIGDEINARDIGYPPYGIIRRLSRGIGQPELPRHARRRPGLTNSNAVVSTLVRAMGLPPERPSLFAPGAGVMLLGEETVNATRARHGFGPISLRDVPAPTPAIRPDAGRTAARAQPRPSPAGDPKSNGVERERSR